MFLMSASGIWLRLIFSKHKNNKKICSNLGIFNLKIRICIFISFSYFHNVNPASCYSPSMLPTVKANTNVCELKQTQSSTNTLRQTQSYLKDRNMSRGVQILLIVCLKCSIFTTLSTHLVSFTVQKIQTKDQPVMLRWKCMHCTATLFFNLEFRSVFQNAVFQQYFSIPQLSSFHLGYFKRNSNKGGWSFCHVSWKKNI